MLGFISGTTLVAILCILSNFNTCFFLCGDDITKAYYSFGLPIVVIIHIVANVCVRAFVDVCL